MKTYSSTKEKLAFFHAFIAHPRQVGAVLPTSRRTVRAMLDMGSLPRARYIIEFGAGTGVCTEEILKRLGPDAQVLAFEIDPGLAAGLVARFDDQRLRVIQDSAENVEAYLDGARVDVIVSALPFTTLPKGLKDKVFGQVTRVLAPGGVMLVIQYSTLLQRDLQRTFDSVSRRVSPFNVPPAFLFACRAPTAGT